MCKPWYKSKTLWFNILTIATAIAGGFLGILPTYSPLLGEHTYTLVLVIVSTLNVVLRAVTTGPINWSEDDTSEG